MTNAPTGSSLEKTASRIIIYLIEELGDARLRAAQLKRYVEQATDLVEKSEHRDALFEVAAHLIQGIPETLFKLEKALDASALAAARMDYEEIKQGLKPEKADELEDVMEDTRIRYLKRRSDTDPSAAPDEEPMTPKEAASALRQLASQTQTTGQVPIDTLLTLVASLEAGSRTAGDTQVAAQKAAATFEAAAKYVEGDHPSRTKLAASLRRVLADAIQPTGAALAASGLTEASSREDVMKGFKEANPDLTEAQLNEIADQWERNKDVVKDKTATSAKPASTIIVELMNGANKLYDARVPMRRVSQTVADLYSDPTTASGFPGYQNPDVKKVRDGLYELDQSIGSVARSMENLARLVDRTTKTASENEDKQSRFTKGEPADPTENMDNPEDKAEWERQNKEHKDQFKAASTGDVKKIYDVLSGAFLDGMGKGGLSQGDLDSAADDLAHTAKEVASMRWQTTSMLGKVPQGSLNRLATSVYWLANFMGATADQGSKTATDETAEAKQSRFTKGEPADPTENMDNPEDKAEWERQNKEHKDQFKAAADTQTVKLDSSGEEVLAKKDKGELKAVTYANRSQANAAADKMGEGWEVIQRGRPWYLRKDKGAKTAADMTSHYAFGMAASKVQMAVDAFAYAEDWQGYARGWSNLSKGLIILEEFFRDLLPIAAKHLDQAGKACQGKDINIPILGYQHLEEAQKELSRAADVARQGNIESSFKKLAGAMEHMAEMGKEARYPAFIKPITDAGVIFRRHDTSPFEDKMASENEDKLSKFKKDEPVDMAEVTKNMSEEDAKKWKAEHDKNKDNFKAASASSELKEMQDLLKAKGYDPKDAKKLQADDMGPEELAQRLKEKGGLERTHGLKKTASQNPWKA